MLEQLARESTNMVMASSNEGNTLNYISGTYEGKDTLHTVISGIPIAYAFSRKAGDMAFQIGIIDKGTKKETWRSQPLLRSWEAASVCPSAVPPVCMPYR